MTVGWRRGAGGGGDGWQMGSALEKESNMLVSLRC
jgi:hypothetical protein